MRETNSFSKGIRNGLPICFGYLSVAFAFAIFAVANGLTGVEAVLISMTNVTSAGQLAAVPIIAGGGSLIELGVSQLVINLRYALMSVSLSQRLGKSVRLRDRLIIGFVNTDEVFAVTMAQGESVGRRYLYGLILTPYLGWTGGTALGIVAGGLLPVIVIDALGLAIYGMFIAIVLPKAREHGPTAVCVGISVLLSCLCYYVPMLKQIPTGFTVILCAVAASSILAVAAPIKGET